MRATYSPEDNKLRFYPNEGERLSPEDYAKFKEAGFRWAPKQKLFVAPMWTPKRFDLLVDFVGFVDDEEQSLQERAEQRAERFGVYQEKRLADAHSAKDHADALKAGEGDTIARNTQEKADRQAAKIEGAMKKAVSMWETSKYWESRAAGSISDAQYKERPDVRARRIKKLVSGLRKHDKEKMTAEKFLTFWSAEDLTLELATKYANYGVSFYMPRKKGDKEDFTGHQSAWGALTDSYTDSLYAKRTLEEVTTQAIKVMSRSVYWHGRWCSHYENRLTYEKAMLEAQGASDLIAPKARPKQPKMLNLDAPLTRKKIYSRDGETEVLPVHHMTKEEYSKIYSKGCIVSACGTYKQKCAPVRKGDEPSYMAKRHAIFLTDSKAHTIEGSL